MSPLVHEPSKIANILNSHFASCGHRLAAKLPHSEKHFSEFLGKTRNPKLQMQYGSFAFLPVEPIEVEQELFALPSNKSFGLYSCPIRILKCAKHILSTPLAKIINTSIQRGSYPKKLKIRKIIPVFKAEDETEPNNYRPISLLSIFNKIFEKLIYKRLKSYLDKYNVISPSQYGFRERHSTEHAILDIINRIQTNMDKKLYSCGIFIDLSKAFDTVDHNILLSKLHYYGIRGVINDWFASYLKDRYQTTQIRDAVSEKKETLCGVPQGSVLGPLLFLLYVNDICHSSDIFDFFLFADDTNLLYANSNLKTLETIVNKELQKLSDWLIANKLTLNIKKSNFVIFRPYQKKIYYQPVIKLFDSSSHQRIPLDSKDYVKYLGILVDSNISWKHHIDYIALKISKIVGIISRIRHLTPPSILLNLYSSLILPYLSYGVVAWGRAPKLYKNKLLILQKRALRLIYFKHRQEHAIPLFVNSNFLPIDMIYFEKTANLMYDVNFDLAPIPIQNLFQKSSDVHSYNTRSVGKSNFSIKFSRLEIQKLSFSRSGPVIWNSIPSCIRNEPKNVFKEKLRSLLRNILETEDDYIDIQSIIQKSSIFHF